MKYNFLGIKTLFEVYFKYTEFLQGKCYRKYFRQSHQFNVCSETVRPWCEQLLQRDEDVACFRAETESLFSMQLTLLLPEQTRFKTVSTTLQ